MRKFYRIHNPILRPDIWVEMEDEFAIPVAKEQFALLEGKVIRASPGNDINPKTIHRTDLLDTGRNPYVSSNFKEKLESYLKNEVEFFPAILENDKGVYENWFVMQPLKRLSLVNTEAPEIPRFEAGFPRDKTVFFIGKSVMNQVEDDFYLALDTVKTTYLFCSEKFRNLCREKGLKIKFERQLDESYVRISDIMVPDMIWENPHTD